jgi:hypothetical protein
MGKLHELICEPDSARCRSFIDEEALWNLFAIHDMESIDHMYEAELEGCINEICFRNASAVKGTTLV